MKSRAERRHHHNRMIEKVKHFWWLQKDKYWGSEEKRQKHIRKMAETRHPCSCHMCGNPRTIFNEVTMQEKRIKESERYAEQESEL